MSALDEARRLARELLAPTAEQTDRRPLIPRSHLDALADAGLYGLAGPITHGGVDPATRRQVMRVVAGACGTTGFVWAQHHGLLAQLTGSPAPSRDALVPELATGRLRAGVAFAHLRRADPGALTVTERQGGWRLDGSAPWVTGWGRIDLVRLGAVDRDRILRWFVVAVDRPGISARPVPLSVLTASGTVEIQLDRLELGPDDLVAEQDLDEWLADDAPTSSRVNPAVMGLVDRSIELLEPLDGPAAAALGLQRDALDRSESQATEPRTAANHRAACLDLARRATTALLAASGGRGVELTHPAQRLAREAAFYVVQAQNPRGRAATIAAAVESRTTAIGEKP